MAPTNLQVVTKCFLRKADGTVDYTHGYDFIASHPTVAGLYFVKQGDLIGYMDADGHFVIPLKYDFARVNHLGETILSDNSHWRRILNGETDNFIFITTVFKNGFVGIVDSTGKELVPCSFAEVDIFHASSNFVPVAFRHPLNKRKLIWGMYNIALQMITVMPKEGYESFEKEKNGYVSFISNGKWGLLDCYLGHELITPSSLRPFQVKSCVWQVETSPYSVIDFMFTIAYLGNNWESVANIRWLDYSSNCQLLMLNPVMDLPTTVILSDFNLIECSGPMVFKCHSIDDEKHAHTDTFKLVFMPNYLALIKNAEYQSGYFLKETGDFVTTWSPSFKLTPLVEHAQYIGGGTLLAKTFDGQDIPVTSEMEEEILKCVNDYQYLL